jgi:hypothetical protein
MGGKQTTHGRDRAELVYAFCSRWYCCPKFFLRGNAYPGFRDGWMTHI